MSSEKTFEFTKENIDLYLSAVAKEYRKRVGKAMPAELILIGGASVLINYGFRNATTDVDAVIEAASSMKDAINAVGDRMGLPNGWLNADFRQTESYSPKLVEVSVYYRAFSNVVRVCTVSAEYLIAMKLRAGRRYKNDLSDVIGLSSHTNEDFFFVARHTSVLSAFGMTLKRKAHDRQVGLLLVTEHGKPKEKLLGVITSTDLAKLSLSESN